LKATARLLHQLGVGRQAEAIQARMDRHGAFAPLRSPHPNPLPRGRGSIVGAARYFPLPQRERAASGNEQGEGSGYRRSVRGEREAISITGGQLVSGAAGAGRRRAEPPSAKD
jgi:hypothetical protein